MPDPTSVLATLDRIAAAWNAGDAAAYGTEFTEDVTYVMFDGQMSSSRKEVEDVHRWLFDGPLKGSRMGSVTGADPVVRFLAPGVAHVVVGGAVRPQDAAEVTAERESVVSFVLVDEGTAWKVAAFQNTRRRG